MTRHETEDALAEVQSQIARLQARHAVLAARLMRDDDICLPRPGWPMTRAAGGAGQAMGRRISTSASSRIAV